MPAKYTSTLIASLIGSSLLLGACSDGSDRMPGNAMAATPIPLVIKEQGSFFVGGEVLNRGPDDDVTINQMYVQYQVPDGETSVPIVMTHGCCMSSKIWETTPDGRMGWNEYFVRNGHPVYLAEQSGRARSGFNATVYNQVATGELPAEEQPLISHESHQWAWDVLRFGPEFGVPFEDGQFPVEAVDNFWKQMIPDMNSTLPEENPSWSNLADLASQLGGAVLMGFSQSGTYPLEAAMQNPASVKGIVLLETARCRFYWEEDQLEVFANIPMLFLYGDHLVDAYDGNWETYSLVCEVLAQQINDAGGNARVTRLPELGVFGNSHMLMQDRNNLKVADLIMDWMVENVR